MDKKFFFIGIVLVFSFLSTDVDAQSSAVILTVDNQAALEQILAILAAHNTTLNITYEENFECEQNETLCHEHATCNDVEYTFECICNSGYYDTSYGDVGTATCNDVNECANFTSTSVISILDGLSVSCTTDTNCILTDEQIETAMNVHGLTAQYTSVTAVSNGVQERFSGTFSTESIAKFLSYIPCDLGSECSNIEGSYMCTCSSGYSGNGSQCLDVNECDGTNDCDPNASCANEIGSYSCTCNIGYTGTGTECTDVDECIVNPCDINADCTNSAGSYGCECHSGLSGDGSIESCEDIPECATELHNCHDNAACTEIFGSFSCSCDSGFNGDGVECADIDECTDDTDDCHVNARCTNTEGSYSCACDDGYTGDGFTCLDVDECDGSPCDENGNCLNSIGSYTCSCNDGYSGSGHPGNCEDIDECFAATEVNTYMWDMLTMWKNRILECDGSGEGSGGADDCSPTVDELNTFWAHLSTFSVLNVVPKGSNSVLQNYGPYFNTEFLDNVASYLYCDYKATCLNDFGDYSCMCEGGYQGDGTQCLDMNECDMEGSCDENAVCSNSVGGFECACLPGYRGSGQPDECEEINECIDEAHPHGCDENAFCTNTPGGNNCTCKPGYAGDGEVCTDVDECSQSDLNTCAVNGKCMNTLGSYNCSCYEGFMGDGHLCIESLDRCNVNSLPNCSMIMSTSCDYAMSHTDHAQQIFDQFRYFFKVPDSVQRTECRVMDPMEMMMTDHMMLGTDPMMMGTHPMMMGTDPMMMGTDPMTMGTDPMMMGTDPMMATTDPMMIDADRYSAMMSTTARPTAMAGLTPKLEYTPNLGICDTMTRTEFKTSAYINPMTKEVVELFHFGRYFQWFKIGKCAIPHMHGPIGCAQRYFPQNALTIRRYGSKYLVQLERVYFESGCEVDLFL